ncbi:restriction endonuclease subunit S [Methylicorpusculum sp.]|uniref:restriction endonuclease subunit S n=1 Tax=Methylicorpusculum sp. TaxID=2713644 RepID=UPI002725C813|nr:restriction endonuclease subunit S [Methylicorpusculum sp.]MDO8844104.1 restriction endonuclease subunit S [Methylicorpusculum sp.]
MSSEWRLTTLGKICVSQGGAIQTGPFGSQLHTSDYKIVGVPVVMPTNIGGDGGIAETGIARIDQSDVDRLSQHKLQIADIVFSRRGDVTKNALIRSHEVGWLCGTGCLKVRLGNETIALAKFISYYLRQPDIKEWLVRHAVGATMPNLNTGILSAVPIFLPPIQIQQGIAEILGALDDRISLLHETNTTLEAIAQTLFKSWFVDFDPVHAKQQGLEPEGMDAETAALFPDSFEESELGLVPRGWKSGILGEELKIAYGKNLPTSKLLESGYPVFGGNGRIGFIDKFIYETRQVLVACRGAASGKINQSPPLSFVTNNSLILESNESTLLPFGYLKGYMLRSDLIPFVTGSAQPQVTIDNLKNFKILVPSTETLSAFESFSCKIEDRIEENTKQAQTLASIRDTLLPCLISGQLRLPEAEAMIEGIGR